jgi:prenyltransferase beta subunit
VSEPNNVMTPPAPERAAPAVIRLIHGAEETPTDRLLKKHLPAWVVSGAFHVIILVVAILIGFSRQGEARLSDEIVTTIIEERPPDEKNLDLTNPDLGLDSELLAAIEVDRIEDLNVDAKVVADEPVGVPNADLLAPMDVPALAGIGANLNDLGVMGEDGSVMQGTGGMAGMIIGKAFQGRSGATKEANLRAGGGNAASEAAVARGLVWLARQQRQNGSWVFDGTSKDDTIAATGMSLLPFLAAGQTHKRPLGPAARDYSKNVAAGLDWLLKNQRPDGSFTGSSGMYAHAIATMALCEAYGMTGDKARLQYPCQRAINYILSGQGANGSWGYRAKTEGDTSIVGWQIQALKSAEMCRDLVVDKRVLDKARKFLDSVAGDSTMSTYGYRSKETVTPARSAVGLLCRYYMDGWGPIHPGMAEGVRRLVTTRPPNPNQFDIYYYYYATQVVHFHDGDMWHKEWNPKMRDLLINLQVSGKGEKLDGSWDPDRLLTGGHVGRLGTTALALLTLEVYYRHLPLYKRDTAGMKELERVK